PPRPPSVRGFASLTVRERPPASCPFRAAMAAWASCSVFISTKPKPLERPVSRSMITCADSTVPCASNIFDRSLSVTPYPRLPTYSFLPMCYLHKKQAPQPTRKRRPNTTSYFTCPIHQSRRTAQGVCEHHASFLDREIRPASQAYVSFAQLVGDALDGLLGPRPQLQRRRPAHDRPRL